MSIGRTNAIGSATKSDLDTYQGELLFPTIPIIELSQNILTVKNAELATIFKIYSNNKVLTTVNVDTIDLSTLITVKGSYTISVKVKSEEYAYSKMSNKVIYEVK